MRQECYFCAIRTVEKLIKKFNPPPKVADDFVSSIHHLINKESELPMPYLATRIHRIAREKLNHSNLYEQEKHQANQLLLDQYSFWKLMVEQHDNPLHMAAKLAVVGNIIDYGAHSVQEDLLSQIHSLCRKEFAIDKTTELLTKIKQAKRILYLGDNAGEIVFDKLFIETLNHPGITYVVREQPVINDVTLEDAQQVGLDEICTVITNGYDAPSTLLEYCSESFKEAYHNADLIISKGQGNFEGLLEQKQPNLYFMLIAKCQPMSEKLSVSNGDMVVTNLIPDEDGI